jgi:hypothetical protein
VCTFENIPLIKNASSIELIKNLREYESVEHQSVVNILIIMTFHAIDGKMVHILKGKFSLGIIGCHLKKRQIERKKYKKKHKKKHRSKESLQTNIYTKESL